MKKLFFMALFLIGPLVSFAQTASIQSDSLGVEMVNGRWAVMHKVQKGQTFFALSRRYNTSAAEWAALNPGKDRNNLREGEIIYFHSTYKPDAATPAQVEKRTLSVTTTNEPEIFVDGFHVVTKGETLFGIANRYGMTTDQLIRLNNIKPGVGIREHQQLKVRIKQLPVLAEQEVERPVALAHFATRGIPISHTVKPRETLFSISKIYDVSLDSLRAWNQLSENAPLAPGKDLVVAWKVSKSGAVQPDTVRVFMAEAGNRTAVSIGIVRKTIIGEKIRKGTVSESSSDLALHRTATIGTFIKVTNPENNKSTIARVIGNVAPNVASEVEIQLSAAACEKLGIVNNQFQVTVEYTQ